MNKTNLIYAAIIAIIAILIWSLNSKDKVLITDDIQPNDTIPAVVLEELIDSTSKAKIDSALNIEE